MSAITAADESASVLWASTFPVERWKDPDENPLRIALGVNPIDFRNILKQAPVRKYFSCGSPIVSGVIQPASHRKPPTCKPALLAHPTMPPISSQE
jgi:hypothetical protein